eukprot:6310827-Lingulodinium_polyedra.AAC.1
MSVCVYVRIRSTKRKRAFCIDEMTGCVYVDARLRQCPCLCAYAFMHVFVGTRVNVLVCPSALVAMP